MSELFYCDGCGCFYTTFGPGYCADCGGELELTRKRPDPFDPWERPRPNIKAPRSSIRRDEITIQDWPTGCGDEIE